jgi:hypothetical protein
MEASHQSGSLPDLLQSCSAHKAKPAVHPTHRTRPRRERMQVQPDLLGSAGERLPTRGVSERTSRGRAYLSLRCKTCKTRMILASPSSRLSAFPIRRPYGLAARALRSLSRSRKVSAKGDFFWRYHGWSRLCAGCCARARTGG